MLMKGNQEDKEKMRREEKRARVRRCREGESKQIRGMWHEGGQAG